MSPKVFVFAPADPTGDAHRTFEQNGCELIMGGKSALMPNGGTEAELAQVASGCDAMIGSMIRSAPISRRVLEGAPNLRVVAKYTIGCDDVDVEAATEMGIMVTHGPTESNWGGVAEGTVANMLCMLKKLRERDHYLKTDGPWRDDNHIGTYLGARSDGYRGITVGILGLGRVGSRVAHLLGPWNVRLIACDPYIDDAQFQRYGVERVDLDTLLRESDVLTLHVFLNRETRHMIGEKQLAQMKPSAILLNAARGPVVDEEARVRARNDKTIAGAALDVFEEEPLPLDSPLRGMGDNVLLSPHAISFNVGSGLGPALTWVTDSALQALRGQVPDNVFNKEVIPAWQKRFGAQAVIA